MLFKILIGFLSLCLMALNQTKAQQYPSENVFIVAPFPPGGTTDLIAREVAARLTGLLGTTVVVDNRIGGSGIVGTDYVARSKPDGHRLLMAGSPHSINNSLRKNIPYDPVASFEPISLLLVLPQVLAVHSSLPVNSAQEFIEFARKNPNALRCGVVPAGSSELAAAMLSTKANIAITHVPYRGDAPVINDLVGGHIDCFIGIANQVLPHIQAGRMRALGVTSRERLEVLPNIQTLIEAGVPDYEASSWNGVFAPAGTPASIIAKLETALLEIGRDPAFRARWVAIGALVPAGDRNRLRNFLAEEIARWKAVIEATGIKSD